MAKALKWTDPRVCPFCNTQSLAFEGAIGTCASCRIVLVIKGSTYGIGPTERTMMSEIALRLRSAGAMETPEDRFMRALRRRSDYVPLPDDGREPDYREKNLKIRMAFARRKAAMEAELDPEPLTK